MRGSGERARPRARIVGVVTRAALFYGASSLAGCGEPPSAPAPEALQAAPVEPMIPNAMEDGMEVEAAAEPAYAVGPVEIEPEASDVAARERADAEEAKRENDRGSRDGVRRQVRVRQVDLRDVVVHSAPPYGAPPVDFPIV
jgi:hypothetical protein